MNESCQRYNNENKSILWKFNELQKIYSILEQNRAAPSRDIKNPVVAILVLIHK